MSILNQSIQPGGNLGRYQLISRIATGGMAEVWLARATGAKGFQKTIVVKTILPHLADDRLVDELIERSYPGKR